MRGRLYPRGVALDTRPRAGMGQRGVAMVDEGLGPTTLGKSVHSLWNAARSLEGEMTMLVDKVSRLLPSGILTQAGKVLAAAAPLAFGFGTQQEKSDTFGEKFELVRAKLDSVASQVAELRERETLLAGGVSQLGARTARFEKALAALARVQGRYGARMHDATGASERLERLATRRDEHITRVTRDLTVQRSQLERVSKELSRLDRQAPEMDATDEAVAVVVDLKNRVRKIESDYNTTRQLQKDGTQGTLHALELTRERLTRLESRITEISREALAKTGRLDALSRHVSSVEGRLSRAIGTVDEPAARVGPTMDVRGATV